MMREQYSNRSKMQTASIKKFVFRHFQSDPGCTERVLAGAENAQTAIQTARVSS
jgi:hypothetical protein